MNKETIQPLFQCPVCGYDELPDKPWSENCGGSQEICPSCGIQFGYTDAAGGDTKKRQSIHRQWRQQWINQGMSWDSIGIAPPPEWNPKAQLEALLKHEQKERESS